MKSRYSKKLFPFSPGIPWTIKNNKYIIPQIDAKIWNRVLQDKDFIVTCYGGFLESFFSLSYFEAFAKMEPYREVYWMGDPDLEGLVSMQGIAGLGGFDLGSEVVDKYPVPIFMDKDNSAYFNVLNNYLITKSYKPSKYSLINKEPVLKQIYQNCMIEYDNFVPKMRTGYSLSYKAWLANNGLHENSKFIVVFPETWKSMHEENCLGWNDRQIREFSQMVKQLNISVISCEKPRVDAFYHAGHIIRAPLDLDIMIGLMTDAFGVLSADIDFLIVSMMLSQTSFIMSRPLHEIYDLYDNADFIGSENVIFTDTELSPRDVFQYLDGVRVI